MTQICNQVNCHYQLTPGRNTGNIPSFQITRRAKGKWLQIHWGLLQERHYEVTFICVLRHKCLVFMKNLWWKVITSTPCKDWLISPTIVVDVFLNDYDKRVCFYSVGHLFFTGWIILLRIMMALLLCFFSLSLNV